MRGLALIALLAPAAAIAQPPPPPPPPPGYGPAPGAGMYGTVAPGTHTHDDFFLRMFFGVGFTSMSAEDQDTTISGAGGAFGIALGFNVSPNLILYGELFDDIAINPTVEVGGMELETQDVSAGIVGVGAGLAYYFQPSNVYVSGTLTYGKLTLQEDGEEIAETKFGLGASVMVGKEWWVSDNWGVGIAAQLFAGQNEDEGTNPATWQTTAFALALSTTYD